MSKFVFGAVFVAAVLAWPGVSRAAAGDQTKCLMNIVMTGDCTPLSVAQVLYLNRNCPASEHAPQTSDPALESECSGWVGDQSACLFAFTPYKQGYAIGLAIAGKSTDGNGAMLCLRNDYQGPPPPVAGRPANRRPRKAKAAS